MTLLNRFELENPKKLVSGLSDPLFSSYEQKMGPIFSFFRFTATDQLGSLWNLAQSISNQKIHPNTYFVFWNLTLFILTKKRRKGYPLRFFVFLPILGPFEKFEMTMYSYVFFDGGSIGHLRIWIWGQGKTVGSKNDHFHGFLAKSHIKRTQMEKVNI
jgi:hypothetical protein